MFRPISTVLSGFAAGVAASYLLDPVAGRRRRALALDKLHRSTHSIVDDLGVAVRDLENRSKGVVYSAMARFGGDDADDRILDQRVRAVIGLSNSHPRAIEIHVAEGKIELRGPILAAEHEATLQRVRSVRGVGEVIDHLEVHAEADVPALQGGRTKGTDGLFERNWSPSTRLLLGSIGAAVAATSIVRGSPFGVVAGLVGLSAATQGDTSGESNARPA